MRGRPKKEHTVNHMIGTRLNDKQWDYVCHRANAEQINVGTALRHIVEERRNNN